MQAKLGRPNENNSAGQTKVFGWPPEIPHFGLLNVGVRPKIFRSFILLGLAAQIN